LVYRQAIQAIYIECNSATMANGIEVVAIGFIGNEIPGSLARRK